MFSLQPDCNSHIKTLLWCALKPESSLYSIGCCVFWRGRTAWLLADDGGGHGDDGDDNDDASGDDIGSDGGDGHVMSCQW